MKLFYIDDDGDYGYWIVAENREELIADVLPGYDLDDNPHLDISEYDDDFNLRIYFPDGIDEDSELPTDLQYDAEKRNMPFVEALASEWMKVSKSGDMLACWGI